MLTVTNRTLALVSMRLSIVFLISSSTCFAADDSDSCTLLQRSHGFSSDSTADETSAELQKNNDDNGNDNKDNDDDSDSSNNAGAFHPFDKSSRIAIVGAGPAGVHIASRLKKLGYNKLTLFERTERVGGKSYSIYLDANGNSCTQRLTATNSMDTTSCIPHEMGTCFLHNGYHAVRNLVEEYDLTPEIVPEGRAIFSRFTPDHLHSQGMSEYIGDSIGELIKAGTVSVPLWVTAMGKEFSNFFAFVDGVEKYIALHEDLFGSIEFSMPERPPSDKLTRINMSFSDFLGTNGLHAIKFWLEFAHTAQGYGYVTSIPALYGLSWISPELLKGFVTQSVKKKMSTFTTLQKMNIPPLQAWWRNTIAKLLIAGVDYVTTMLPEGFGKLWTTIVERDGLRVLRGVEIAYRGIDRQIHDASAPVLITYKHDGEDVTEEFDFLIYTAAHSHAQRWVSDLVEPEADAFSKLTSFVLSTTLYESDPVAGYTDAATDKPIMYNTQKVRGPESDGLWYSDRWDARTQAAHLQGRQTRVGYQFVENGCRFDNRLCNTDRIADPYLSESGVLRHHFLQELESQGVTNVTVIRQFPWPYFHHYENSEIASGVPWDIVDMQGQRKTWWLGASAFFESVHDVINYNLMIMRKYLGARFNKDGSPAPRELTAGEIEAIDKKIREQAAKRAAAIRRAAEAAAKALKKWR